MKVKVQYFASLREIIGLREEILDLQENDDVRRLLEFLVDRHGTKLKEYIFDAKVGTPKQYLQFIIDGKSISTLQGLETKLHDGSTFAVIPPVGGG
jgi:MoaD family protein